MTNKTLTRTFLALTFLPGVFSIVFDCRRDRPKCDDNGFCQPSSGLCVCSTTDFIDYACGLNKTAIPDPCPVACENGGTCREAGQPCYCPAGYYGEFCEKKRVDVYCEGDRMNITLRPYTEPYEIYVPGFKDNSDCVAQKNNETGDFEISIYFNGSVCGAGEGDTILADTPEKGDTTFKNFLLVQYSSLIDSPLDDMFSVSCLIPGNNSVPITGNIVTNAVDQRGDLPPDEATGTYEGILFEFLDPTGMGLTTASMGDDIMIRISLKDTTVNKALKVQSCEVKDNDVNATTTVVMIIDGCVNLEAPASHIMRSGLERGELAPDSLPYVTWNITAFKFVTTPDLYFYCTTLVCADGDNSCNDSEKCPSDENRGENRGRPKRATEDKQAKVSGRLVIVDSFDKTRPQANQGSDHSSTEMPDFHNECVMSQDITTIFIILGATIGFLAIVCVFLAVRYIRISSLTKIEESAPSF